MLGQKALGRIARLLSLVATPTTGDIDSKRRRNIPPARSRLFMTVAIPHHSASLAPAAAYLPELSRLRLLPSSASSFAPNFPPTSIARCENSAGGSPDQNGTRRPLGSRRGAQLFLARHPTILDARFLCHDREMTDHIDRCDVSRQQQQPFIPFTDRLGHLFHTTLELSSLGSTFQDAIQRLGKLA